MKTIFITSGKWILILLILSFAVFLFNLNLFTKVDQMITRLDFEEFLNTKVKEYLSTVKVQDAEALSDNPEMAALQDYLSTVDPKLKRVPKERLQEAYKVSKHLAALKGNSDFDLIEWQSTESNIAGRTRALMWDPNDPDMKKVWAGGVTGGLWYKDDITNDANWVAVDDFWPGLAISCITYDPNNLQHYFVGTGEAQTALIIYRESSGVGFGIMHSTDTGVNWEVMPGTESFEYITDIKIRNESGISVMYVGVASGIYKGTQHLSEPSDGLYRHVMDSGLWEQVLPFIDGVDQPYTPADIEFGADGRIYVGSMPNVDGAGGATILFSDSGLEGSWTLNYEYKILIENTPGFDLPGRVILATAPSDANRVYACIAQGYFYGIPGYECHILARSDDKGESWSMITKPPNVSGNNWAFIAWHALSAAVDPNNADRVFVGGLDLFRSDDAGITWSKKTNWQGIGSTNYVHADHHHILFQPGSSNKFIIGTDGGVFYTFNASITTPGFSEKNFGMNTLQFYKCAIDPQEGNIFFLGGLQDNGTVLYDGNPLENANRITGGDGGACFIDKNEPDVFITSYQNNRFFLFGNFQYQSSATQWASGNFISSVDYDYKLNTLYANAVSVTNQLQDSILRISGIPYGPLSGDFLNLNTGSTVPFTHVKYSNYSPLGQASLYCGTQSGRMFKVENAQDVPMVEEIGSNNFPTASISCIAFGGSEDTILVTFSNFGVSSVWQTYDNGTSWDEKEGNLPDMPVRWAVYHPACAKSAMIATEMGIWTSYNLNEENPEWMPDNEGLANVRVDMLQLREEDNMVLAGSHGRGFFYGTYNYNPSLTKTKAKDAVDLNIAPNPTNGRFEIALAQSDRQIRRIDIYNSAGQTIRTYETPMGGTREIFDIKGFRKGTYFLKITTSKGTLLKKIIKN
ncbi:MAG: T9SS type A sorting domain-containing protein [Bacteroidales bacterium]|nr:T9SS type A sorting domain-containing protein [Bacteroidales bacterium]MCF8406219.1 T9SS type A sorting domain-containing protein [Bacteroidales bacterium]